MGLFIIWDRRNASARKSKNFTSDNEIRIPPVVPLNHNCGLRNQQNRTAVLFHYFMLRYSGCDNFSNRRALPSLPTVDGKVVVYHGCNGWRRIRVRLRRGSILFPHKWCRFLRNDSVYFERPWSRFPLSGTVFLWSFRTKYNQKDKLDLFQVGTHFSDGHYFIF